VETERREIWDTFAINDPALSDWINRQRLADWMYPIRWTAELDELEKEDKEQL
jgi:hypothetical protein